MSLSFKAMAAVTRGFAFCCALALPIAGAEANFAPAANSPQSQKASTDATGLRLVRSFASAGDMKRLSPALDKTLTIIAGHADPSERTDLLRAPSAITADAKHVVYVADPGEQLVHIFDFAASKYRELKDTNRFVSPVAVALDARENLYIVDADKRVVLVYDAARKFVRELGRLSGGESYFDTPAGLAVDPLTGTAYVCDRRRHMVIALDKRGKVLANIGKRGGGSGPAEFRSPAQIVLAGGELLVLDAGNVRVEILDKAGHFRRNINLPNADLKTGLAVDRGGNIYVSDTGMNLIRVFSPTGQPLYTQDLGLLKDANFTHPAQMWMSGECLLVIDSQTPQVGMFDQVGSRAASCP